MAEEIVSDVFINIWKGRKHLEEIDNFKTYLYISTKNISLKYLLKQHKQVAIAIDALDYRTGKQRHSSRPNDDHGRYGK